MRIFWLAVPLFPASPNNIVHYLRGPALYYLSYKTFPTLPSTNLTLGTWCWWIQKVIRLQNVTSRYQFSLSYYCTRFYVLIATTRHFLVRDEGSPIHSSSSEALFISKVDNPWYTIDDKDNVKVYQKSDHVHPSCAFSSKLFESAKVMRTTHETTTNLFHNKIEEDIAITWKNEA
jgi:hypothetical protein